MAGTMSRADLVTDLKSMLMDSKEKFTDPDDFERHLDTAARDLSRLRPLVKRATLTLTADTGEYTAPADCRHMLTPLWGKKEMTTVRPWEDNWPGQLPKVSLVDAELHLVPAPTAAQITQLGEEYPYRYVAAWVIGATAELTNIPDYYRDMLLIRATAAGMQDLCNRNVTKPVRLGECGGQPGANGTPAGVAEELMKRFEKMAA